MREILFRGKRKDNGEWVDGNLFVDEKGDKHEIILGYVNYRVGWEVDPETVGQYIGIKDVRGNKIFEGDVLASTTKGKQPKTKVLLVISDIRKCTNTEMWVHGMKFAVIGNIHDNPEFMEAYKESANSGGLATWED